MTLTHKLLRRTSQGENGCLDWTGYVTDSGYGSFRLKWSRKWIAAHRLMYQMFVGPIPDGLVIDHLCRNRKCVNPAHLEAVTHQTNILRGEGCSVLHAFKTHCIKGHPLAGDNLTVGLMRRRNERGCRTCKNARERIYIQRKADRLRAEGVQFPFARSRRACSG